MQKSGIITNISKDGICEVMSGEESFKFDLFTHWKSSKDLRVGLNVNLFFNDLGSLTHVNTFDIIVSDMNLTLYQSIFRTLFPNNLSFLYFVFIFLSAISVTVFPVIQADFYNENIKINFFDIIMIASGDSYISNNHFSFQEFFLLIIYFIIMICLGLLISLKSNSKKVVFLILGCSIFLLHNLCLYIFYLHMIENNTTCLSSNIQSIISSALLDNLDLLFDGIYNNGELCFGFFISEFILFVTFVLSFVNYFSKQKG